MVAAVTCIAAIHKWVEYRLQGRRSSSSSSNSVASSFGSSGKNNGKKWMGKSNESIRWYVYWLLWLCKLLVELKSWRKFIAAQCAHAAPANGSLLFFSTPRLCGSFGCTWQEAHRRLSVEWVPKEKRRRRSRRCVFLGRKKRRGGSGAGGSTMKRVYGEWMDAGEGRVRENQSGKEGK